MPPTTVGTVPLTVFTKVTDGDGLIVATVGRSFVAVVPEMSVTSAPAGDLPVTLAVLLYVPASTSPCVRVCEAVTVMLAPGARPVTGEPVTTALASVMVRLLKVTLPVFLIVRL